MAPSSPGGRDAYELYSRELGDGRTVSVVPLLFGRARLHVAPTGSWSYDDGW